MGSFRWFTAGESHGPGLTVIIDGVPSGLPLSEAQIRQQLARRQRGYGRGGRMKIETDYAQIRGGVRQGRTMGSPVALWIENRDFDKGLGPDKRPWRETMSLDAVDPPPTQVTRVRPGHADLTASLKFGYEDVRDSLERASRGRVRHGSVRGRSLAGSVRSWAAISTAMSSRSAVLQSTLRRTSIGRWLKSLPSDALTASWRRR